MKKMFKKAIATLLAVTALSAGAVNVFADNSNDSVCLASTHHTHVRGGTTQHIVNSTSAGSHQHPIEYDTNGNVIKFAIICNCCRFALRRIVPGNFKQEKEINQTCGNRCFCVDF